MDESQLRTIEQIEQFLNASAEVAHGPQRRRGALRPHQPRTQAF